MGEAPSPAQRLTVGRQGAAGDEAGGRLVRYGQDHRVGGELGRDGADAEAGLGRVDGGDLGAQVDLGAQPGQQGRAGVTVQLAQGKGGDADVGRVVLAEQAGLDHGGGQREGGVVARDVQRRDGEQVPQGSARVLGLAVGGQPVAEALGVERRVGRIQGAHGERGA